MSIIFEAKVLCDGVCNEYIDVIEIKKVSQWREEVIEALKDTDCIMSRGRHFCQNCKEGTNDIE